MKNYQMGIDISKEKLNICLRKGTQTVLEEEMKNAVAAFRKMRQENREGGQNRRRGDECVTYRIRMFPTKHGRTKRFYG